MVDSLDRKKSLVKDVFRMEEDDDEEMKMKVNGYLDEIPDLSYLVVDL